MVSILCDVICFPAVKEEPKVVIPLRLAELPVEDDLAKIPPTLRAMDVPHWPHDERPLPAIVAKSVDKSFIFDII